MKTDKQLMEMLEGMTLEEKTGQMVQLVEDFVTGTEGVITGPLEDMKINPEVGKVIGSVLGSSGADHVKNIQSQYLANSRHRIPLLFMSDVIHGYRTLTPIPLGQSCSFDPGIVETGAKMAATEAGYAGVHVNFSPMCDLIRDPRWGRVMESTGEDQFLNGLFSEAMVRGYQNNDLKDSLSIASCVKHFAAYGAAQAGRDYNTVDMSERTLREFYLPAYKKAIDAGCRLVMTSFNIVDGIPATGNRWLLRDVLRGEWGFDGVVISDWGAVSELVAHGYAADKKEAARLAISAGVDIDMMSSCYANYLPELVREGQISEKLIDEAVLRILKLKRDMGLFENPDHGADMYMENKTILSNEIKDIAKSVSDQSLVLLKNENILPLPKGVKSIGLIGPYATARHILGGWSCFGEDKDAANLLEAIMQKTGNEKIYFAKGCEVEGDFLDLDEVDDVIGKCDELILAIGEHPGMSGEAGSRAILDLPGRQKDLCRHVFSKNKRCIVVLFNGRPLDIRDLESSAGAIVEAWFPGTQGAYSIADLLFGDITPRGRLSMSFPYVVGQIPVHYNSFNTGRPKVGDDEDYFKSGYLDIPNEPLYPFGFGLGFTTFEYSNLTLDKTLINSTEFIKVRVAVKNTGNLKGFELVQLYLRDVTGSVVRPVKELKNFTWIELDPGEEKVVEFTINEEMLKFYDAKMDFKSEPGEFIVMVGGNSRDVISSSFWLA